MAFELCTLYVEVLTSGHAGWELGLLRKYLRRCGRWRVGIFAHSWCGLLGYARATACTPFTVVAARGNARCSKCNRIPARGVHEVLSALVVIVSTSPNCGL